MCSYRKGKYGNLDAREKLTDTVQQLKEQLDEEVIYRISYRRSQERNKTLANGIFEIEVG
jgi:hypothetical protein